MKNINSSIRCRFIIVVLISLSNISFHLSLFRTCANDNNDRLSSNGGIVQADAWRMTTPRSSSKSLLAMASSSETTTTSTAATAGTSLRHVLVTGASGRTGQLVFSSLLDDPRFEPKALVRSKKSAKKLMKQVPKTRLDQIIISDVTTLLQQEEDQQQQQPTEKDSSVVATKATVPVPPGLNGIDSMVICTSAVPTISKISLLKAFLAAPFNLIRGKKAIDFRNLKFVWKYGCYPEIVDYHGQISQIELAKQLNMKEIIVVGSMGGTETTNFLNSVGKNRDGTGNGDILLWKRKAEKYLLESGLDYVIIHPGGLIDTVPGQEEYIIDVNDKLITNKKRSISRADVARLCVAALALDIPNAINCPRPISSSSSSSYSSSSSSTRKQTKQIALDCITQLPEDGKPIRTADEALADFLKQSKMYDYSL